MRTSRKALVPLSRTCTEKEKWEQLITLLTFYFNLVAEITATKFHMKANKTAAKLLYRNLYSVFFDKQTLCFLPHGQFSCEWKPIFVYVSFSFEAFIYIIWSNFSDKLSLWIHFCWLFGGMDLEYRHFLELWNNISSLGLQSHHKNSYKCFPCLLCSSSIYFSWD